MKYVRNKDLNDFNIDPRLTSLWRARYYGMKINSYWTMYSIVVEKQKERFKITTQELIILESVLWAERITISSLAKYLNKKTSNLSRSVNSMISRGILEKDKYKTLNITKEFSKPWYNFFDSAGTKLLINESLEEVIPKLELAAEMMKDSLLKIKQNK